MNETKSVTLGEARDLMEQELKNAEMPARWRNVFDDSAASAVAAIKQGLSILARVEQPSEEGRAVLWLMKEHGWKIAWTLNGWITQLSDPHDGHTYWLSINPVEEAKKLGWKP